MGKGGSEEKEGGREGETETETTETERVVGKELNGDLKCFV